MGGVFESLSRFGYGSPIRFAAEVRDTSNTSYSLATEAASSLRFCVLCLAPGEALLTFDISSKLREMLGSSLSACFPYSLAASLGVSFEAASASMKRFSPSFIF